jgi:hypothetical protein
LAGHAHLLVLARAACTFSFESYDLALQLLAAFWFSIPSRQAWTISFRRSGR